MTNLISLNIFIDFCSTWWLWWIFPFVLGISLGVVVMKKWKTMYHQLTQETRVGRNNLKESELRLEELLKEQKDLKGQLAIQRGKIRELESKLSK